MDEAYTQYREMKQFATKTLPEHPDLYLRPESYGEAGVMAELAMSSPATLYNVLEFLIVGQIELDMRLTTLEGQLNDVLEEIACPSPKSSGYEVAGDWG